jgi:hypothetical protein
MDGRIASLQTGIDSLHSQILQSLDLAGTNMRQNKMLEEQIIENGEFYDGELKNMRQHVQDAGG